MDVADGDVLVPLQRDAGAVAGPVVEVGSERPAVTTVVELDAVVRLVVAAVGEGLELRSVAVEREVRLGPDHDGKFRAVAALGPELRDGPVRQRVEPGLDLRADLRHRGAASRPALNVIGQFVYGGAWRLPRRNRYAAAGDQNQPGSQ